MVRYSTDSLADLVCLLGCAHVLVRLCDETRLQPGPGPTATKCTSDVRTLPDPPSWTLLDPPGPPCVNCLEARSGSSWTLSPRPLLGGRPGGVSGRGSRSFQIELRDNLRRGVQEGPGGSRRGGPGGSVRRRCTSWRWVLVRVATSFHHRGEPEHVRTQVGIQDLPKNPLNI